MSYKGNDLDLQTPRTLGGARPAPAPLERPANGSAPPLSTAEPGPIAVDDTVLACCNMAYDVARFHVSPDVKLEHLLHALTRVGPAVDVLAASAGPARDMAIDDWCRSVWTSFDGNRQTIIALLRDDQIS